MKASLGMLQEVIGPLLEKRRLDPVRFLNKLGGDQLEQRLAATLPVVVARLRADEVGPEDGARHFIRAAMYLTLKELFRPILPFKLGRLANNLADEVRDYYDDKVVARLEGRLITPDTSLEDGCRVVLRALAEQVF